MHSTLKQSGDSRVLASARGALVNENNQFTSSNIILRNIICMYPMHLTQSMFKYIFESEIQLFDIAEFPCLFIYLS